MKSQGDTKKKINANIFRIHSYITSYCSINSPNIFKWYPENVSRLLEAVSGMFSGANSDNTLTAVLMPLNLKGI